MRIWTTKEAGLVKAWAATQPETRTPLEQLADSLRRTTRSIQDFLRRELGPGNLPWRERPRWTRDAERSAEAVRKFTQRHRQADDEEPPENGYTISEVARDLGISRMGVYRLLREGKLRRFKGRIAESSFESLLRNHPELPESAVMKLVGTTKTTIAAIRDRTHWNATNIKPVDPVSLGLCSQLELDFAVQKVNARWQWVIRLARAVGFLRARPRSHGRRPPRTSSDRRGARAPRRIAGGRTG